MFTYRLNLTLLLLMTLFMGACGGQTTPTAAPTATPLPATATPVPPTATVAAPTVSPIEAAASLSSLFIQKVPTITQTELGGIEGVMTLPATSPVDQTPLWIAYTYGMVNYEAQQKHLVGIYKQNNAQWEEVATLALESEPSYLPQEGVKTAPIDEQNLWLTVESGTGAHSGCFDVLRFDGQTLTTGVSYCSSSAGAGQLQDLDQDGKPEVILNQTDYYVFCYACGVQALGYQALKWTGGKLQPLTLQTLPDTAEAQLREANNQAVAFAQAELWQDAATRIAQAAQLAPQDPTVSLNQALINLYALPYASMIKENSTGYPLLTQVFYGDYSAALKVMQPHTPAEIFNPTGPLIAGTPAEGWLENIQTYLNQRTTAALTVKPDLAAAYFLRAWGNYLVDAKNPTIITDLQKAVELQPNEKLLTDSLTWLQSQ